MAQNWEPLLVTPYLGRNVTSLFHMAYAVRHPWLPLRVAHLRSYSVAVRDPHSPQRTDARYLSRVKTVGAKMQLQAYAA